MNRSMLKTLASALVIASIGLFSQAQADCGCGGGLLAKLHAAKCGGGLLAKLHASKCGCAEPAPACCEPAPACGCGGRVGCSLV